MNTIDRLKSKVHRAGLRVQPPIRLPVLEQFEAEAGIRLPEDYRDFLLNVANGGTEPCRLVPLSRWDSSYWIDNPIPEMVALRCIVTPEAEKQEERWLDCTDIAGWSARWDRNEWDPMFGTIAVAEIGCGLYYSMVMTGPYRGRIFSWGDALNPPMFYPQSNFSEWLESSLDNILEGGHVHFLDGRIQ